MCYLRCPAAAFSRSSARSSPFCLVLCFLGPLWSPTSRESRQRRVWCLLVVSVSRIRCPSFGCNSAQSPPFELVLCTLESPWSRTVRELRHCRVCVSLAAFVSPRMIPRGVHNLAQSYPFDVVFGGLGRRNGFWWVGAPQAAEKIQDRTCVLILEHWYLEITTLILHTGGTLQKTVFNSKRHKIS